MSNNDKQTPNLLAWAGPAVFTVTAICVLAFFWWFL
jgi:hypothetical protein